LASFRKNGAGLQGIGAVRQKRAEPQSAKPDWLRSAKTEQAFKESEPFGRSGLNPSPRNRLASFRKKESSVLRSKPEVLTWKRLAARPFSAQLTVTPGMEAAWFHRWRDRQMSLREGGTTERGPLGPDGRESSWRCVIPRYLHFPVPGGRVFYIFPG
jgi:hypothetical protein